VLPVLIRVSMTCAVVKFGNPAREGLSFVSVDAEILLVEYSQMDIRGKTVSQACQIEVMTHTSRAIRHCSLLVKPSRCF
jgi:hypothetical protein